MLQRYPSLEHRIVAKLEGIDTQTQSSLGIIMAVSEFSRRIALATWNRVLVYALKPRAFLDRPYADGPAEDFEMDHAYLEKCGHDYYGKSEKNENIVSLWPLELPQSGVVFSLAFRGQNELWGLTDRGLIRWTFGARCDGRRDELLLSSPILSEANVQGI